MNLKECMPIARFPFIFIASLMKLQMQSFITTKFFIYGTTCLKNSRYFSHYSYFKDKLDTVY